MDLDLILNIKLEPCKGVTRKHYTYKYKEFTSIMKSLFINLNIFLLIITTSIFAESIKNKISITPDFCQGNTEYGQLSKSGSSHCAPVAVSNALIQLNKNGFYKFTDTKNPNTYNQLGLIQQLGSSSYMKTSIKSGTKPKNIVAGLERFVHDKGYRIKIETMGWRSKAKRIGKVPSLSWIKKSSLGNSNVVLNIGWYKYDYDSNTYQRTNGHYVTVVGFNGKTIYIHDPAKRDGLIKKTLQCTVPSLRSNSQLKLKSGKSISSNGFFELKCLNIKKGNDLAIIDGAIAFEISK